MRAGRKNSLLIVFAFVICMAVATAGGATAQKLITGKQIKNGSIQLKDLSKDVRKRLARSGAPGVQGPAGAKGDPGPTLVRGSNNGGGSELVPQATKVIVVIDDDITSRTYSGNYSGSLTHPAGLSSYLNIVVTGKVMPQTGSISACDLEQKRDDSDWERIDQALSFPNGRALLFASFPSFTPGKKFAFRISCQGDLTASATGEIAVVAGPVDG